MSGLGNQGGGPQKVASLGQSRKATTTGPNEPGTISAGNSGGAGGNMNAVKQERPDASKPAGGLGN